MDDYQAAEHKLLLLILFKTYRNIGGLNHAV